MSSQKEKPQRYARKDLRWTGDYHHIAQSIGVPGLESSSDDIPMTPAAISAKISVQEANTGTRKGPARLARKESTVILKAEDTVNSKKCID